MTTLIREAISEGAGRIGELYLALTDRVCSVLSSRIAEIARDHNNFLFVAEHRGSVMGTLFLTLCLDPMYGTQPYAILENIVVDPACRNIGLGKALMRHAERHCLDNDCSKIMLLSASNRVDAHKFFDRLGYESGRKLGFVKYRSRLALEASRSNRSS